MSALWWWQGPGVRHQWVLDFFHTLQKEMSSLSCEPYAGHEVVVSLFEVPYNPEAVAAFINREHEFRLVAVRPTTLEGTPLDRLAVSPIQRCAEQLAGCIAQGCLGSDLNWQLDHLLQLTCLLYQSAMVVVMVATNEGWSCQLVSGLCRCCVLSTLTRSIRRVAVLQQNMSGVGASMASAAFGMMTCCLAGCTCGIVCLQHKGFVLKHMGAS